MKKRSRPLTPSEAKLVHKLIRRDLPPLRKKWIEAEMAYAEARRNFRRGQQAILEALAAEAGYVVGAELTDDAVPLPSNMVKGSKRIITKFEASPTGNLMVRYQYDGQHHRLIETGIEDAEGYEKWQWVDTVEPTETFFSILMPKPLAFRGLANASRKEGSRVVTASRPVE